MSGTISNQPGTGICTKEGFFGDPKDCRKFYRCVGDGASFTKYEFQCGVGTAWDSSVQSCNHEYAVPRCSQQNNVVTSEPDTSQNEVDSTNEPDTSAQPPVQPPTSSIVPPESSTSSRPAAVSTTSRPQTSSQISSVSYLPPSSTTNLPSTQTVSSVSYLPPSTQTTTSVSYLPPDTTTSTTMRPTTSVTPSSESSTVSSPQGGKFECPGEGFFPNPDDCRKFYRCVQGNSGYQKYEFQCGPGTGWDQSAQTCNHIGQVSSCSTESNEIDQGPRPSTSSPVPQPPPTSSSTTAASSQTTAITSSSAVPSTESATIASTPSETSTAEATTSRTDKTETSVTTTTAIATTSSSSETSPSGKPEEIQMPASSSTESSSESSESSEQSSTPESSSEGSSSSTESHVPDCTTRKPNDTIACNNEGFYPHPTKCDKFYRCVDNGNGFNVYHFDCPPGTIFDPSINVCNYPESVYPARDCTPSSGTPAAESTTQPESPEQSTSMETTVASSVTTQQPEESTIASTEPVSTTSSEETTTLKPSTTTTTSSTEVTSEMPESTEGTTESTTELTTVATEGSTDSSSSEQTTEATTEEMSTASMGSTESEPVAGAMPCPIGNLTDDQITLVCPTGFRRHPKYCNLFYQCVSEGNMEIKILVLGCPENTIFDENKIQCLPASNSSQPCTGSRASARFYRRLEDNALSPMKVSSNELCPGEGHFPYRQGCTNTFYKCKRDSRDSLQGYLYKCPENFVYWSVSRRCERVTRLPMCAHLAYRGKTDWNDRWQVPVEDYNLSARMLRLP
ncbi:hypothetical protein EAI_01660 [Harpegnathos saltator]|uniref:Chitin-binding type-2 domain-containing protein n=1 Tax=Harpegnathos saltator TaxID=610380 RepID=E2BSP7_HARSA|nr:hypothetical protein EAI_01660 [Harpegnathos saltator]